jgi:hypothetical protein
MAAMSPLLVAALDEAAALAAGRGWSAPSDATIGEAQRLLDLLAALPRAPMVQVEPHGAISLEWEAGEYGWLSLSVEGIGKLEHSAVIEGDEYAQVEDFGGELPHWAGALLQRLLALGH